MKFQTSRTYLTKVLKCNWLYSLFCFFCCPNGHAKFVVDSTPEENALLILVSSKDQCMKGSDMLIISLLYTVPSEKWTRDLNMNLVSLFDIYCLSWEQWTNFMPIANSSHIFVLWNYSTGGVVLATKDGRIVLENTLDARLEVVFKQQLPEVGQEFLFF